MKIILIDSKSKLAKKHAEHLSLISHQVWYWDMNCALFCDGTTFSKEPKVPDSYDLALVHDGDYGFLENAGKGVKRVVVYSAGGDPRHETHPSIKPPIGIDSPIPSEALRRICELALHSDDEWRKGIAELFNAEPALAFRLLREAKAFCGDIESKPHPDAKLMIHAPMALHDWLRPFKTNGRPGLEELAQLIVDQDQTETSAAVKTAISDSDNLEGAVSSYLKIAPASSKS